MSKVFKRGLVLLVVMTSLFGTNLAFADEEHNDLILRSAPPVTQGVMSTNNLIEAQ